MDSNMGLNQKFCRSCLAGPDLEITVRRLLRRGHCVPVMQQDDASGLGNGNRFGVHASHRTKFQISYSCAYLQLRNHYLQVARTICPSYGVILCL